VRLGERECGAICGASDLPRGALLLAGGNGEIGVAHRLAEEGVADRPADDPSSPRSLERPTGDGDRPSGGEPLLQRGAHPSCRRGTRPEIPQVIS
jgi:hypothetical protein